MSRTELKAKADQYRKQAAKAQTDGDRAVLLRKARNYYADAEMGGMVRFCERWLEK